MVDTSQQSFTRIRPVISQTKLEKQGCLLKIHPMDLHCGMLAIDDDPFLIGRESYCSLQISDDSVSRKHAKIRRDHETAEFTLTDLRSTNGTYVNDRPVRDQSIALVAGDVIRVGNHVYKYLTSDHIEAQYHEAAYTMMTHDSLTNVWNKRYFLDMLNREVCRSARSKQPLSLMMLDIDHFKQVNDKHGHLIGDEVLREFALRISNQVRTEDLLARYGGEEFIIALSGTTREQMEVVANRCLKAISYYPFNTTEGLLECTVSIGGASFLSTPAKTEVQGLIRSADRALYQAKNNGRNQIILNTFGAESE